MASVSAGHSTIFASIALHCAPNTADPSAVIRSTICTGGTNGATAGCGISKGGIAGATEAVGLVRLVSGISVFLSSDRRVSAFEDTAEKLLFHAFCDGDRLAWARASANRRRPDADRSGRYLGRRQDDAGTQNCGTIGAAAYRTGCN